VHFSDEHTGYLITGAGGVVGGVSRLVIEQLLSHGEAVRAWCTATTPALTRCALWGPR